MVHADAQCFVLVPQQSDQRFEGFADPCPDGREFLLGKLLSVGVWFIEDKQAWVYPHLVNMLSHLHRNLDAVVMDVGHQRHRATAGADSRANLSHGAGVGHRRRGDTHDFTAGFRQADDAGDGCIDVEGVLIDHRLHHHGVVAADRDITHHHGAGGAAMDLGVVTPIQGGHGGPGRERVNVRTVAAAPRGDRPGSTLLAHQRPWMDCARDTTDERSASLHDLPS